MVCHGNLGQQLARLQQQPRPAASQTAARLALIPVWVRCWCVTPRPCWGLLQGQQHCKPVSEHHDGLENTFSKDRNSFRAWPRHIARTPSPRRGRRALAAPTPRRRLGRLAVESIKHNFELKLHSESLKEHDFLTNLFRGRHKGRKKSI